MKRAVLHTMNPGPFVHEYMEDRAQVRPWEHRSFNNCRLMSAPWTLADFVRAATWLCLAMSPNSFCSPSTWRGTICSGHGEAARHRNSWRLRFDRADTLCDYLVDIHRVKGSKSELYLRRVRELVGHGECIMGINDSYPRHPLITEKLLAQIEHRCLDWRWRLKKRSHRLSQVHGDFHPWNILFRPGVDFTVLDRSRGEYGEPADDVACLTMNYFFFSLQRSERLEGVFETLFLRFWDRYLSQWRSRNARSRRAFFRVPRSRNGQPTLVSDTFKHNPATADYLHHFRPGNRSFRPQTGENLLWSLKSKSHLPCGSRAFRAPGSPLSPQH